MDAAGKMVKPIDELTRHRIEQPTVQPSGTDTLPQQHVESAEPTDHAIAASTAPAAHWDSSKVVSNDADWLVREFAHLVRSDLEKFAANPSRRNASGILLTGIMARLDASGRSTVTRRDQPSEITGNIDSDRNSTVSVFGNGDRRQYYFTRAEFPLYFSVMHDLPGDSSTDNPDDVLLPPELIKQVADDADATMAFLGQ